MAFMRWSRCISQNEEEIYLPLLDARLTSDEAHEMFTAMEHAAHIVKAQLVR
jgi:hypothetical protein